MAKILRVQHNYFNFGCEKVKAGGSIKTKKKTIPKFLLDAICFNLD